MTENSKTDDTASPAAIAHNGPPPANARDLVATPSGANLPAPSGANLPALLPTPKPASSRHWWLWIALALAGLAAGAGGGYYWWQRLHPPLPPGIAFGNGRLEADEINIDTKYAARILQILADEGDLVKAGQVVARMDTQDLAASLKKSQAQVRQAQRAVDEANANVASRKLRWSWQSKKSTAPPIWCSGATKPRRSWISVDSNWTEPMPRSKRPTRG